MACGSTAAQTSFVSQIEKVQVPRENARTHHEQQESVLLVDSYRGEGQLGHDQVVARNNVNQVALEWGEMLEGLLFRKGEIHPHSLKEILYYIMLAGKQNK